MNTTGKNGYEPIVERLRLGPNDGKEPGVALWIQAFTIAEQQHDVPVTCVSQIVELYESTFQGAELVHGALPGARDDWHAALRQPCRQFSRDRVPRGSLRQGIFQNSRMGVTGRPLSSAI